MADVVVVGSGPNGLAAGVVFARAGLEVVVYEAAQEAGGGCRSVRNAEGLVFDTCAVAHPMAVASPFFRAFDLAGHGVDLRVPEVSYAHPLDGGRAGIAWRDLKRTCEGLGADGKRWRGLFGPLIDSWEEVVGAAMGDGRHFRADGGTVRLGVRMLEQGSRLGDWRFAGDIAPALLSGVVAHAMRPGRSLPAAGAGVLLGILGHVGGWVVPRGGSGEITTALLNELRRLGGKVITGRRINSLAEIRGPRAVVCDVSPAELVRLGGREFPDRYRRGLARYRYGPGVCRVDFVLSEDVPWQAPECRLAGTLHVVGSRAESRKALAEVSAGKHPANPYVLVAAPGVVDPHRAPPGKHILYTYTHVPHGSPRDMTDLIAGQIERFAPGFRDTILSRTVRTAADLAMANPNHPGGDIATGAMTLTQTFLRPTPRPNPYTTPLPDVFLCSAATPPGPGVHGMCGLHTATTVLRSRFGIRDTALGLLESR